MLSPLNLLLITAILCVVMLLVLASLTRSGIAGMKEWMLANIVAFVALLLYATRGIAPDFLSIEVANGLLAAAIASIYIGFRKFFALRIPARLLTAGLVLTVMGVAFFHYGQNSISARIVVVSIFHGSVSAGIGLTIFSADKSLRRRYPYGFTGCIAFLFAMGHFVRGLIYASDYDPLTSSLQASSWNLLFLSIGTLVLPVYTMGAVMMVHDKMMSKALDDANRDFLTGVWSRRAFFDIAERELMRARRANRTLSLLVFDVDHFKKLNDTYGHAAGDQVLLAIAQHAAGEIRSIDYLARIGGEEFAVLLPEADTSAALAVAERLRKSLNEDIDIQAANLNTDSMLPVSVSIGAAMANPEESISELLNRADRALYQAKAAGRNMVSLAAADDA
ncbi:GGDEF domain-containing protein [Oxalobacteraceae bacterium R-40]|uniref:diguanylate cyclase n=1 Tax=Keguizhuia sedimenti TaxID=3064264 RepID=A0ABU1BQX1_9BURK|nr:GGDEF domain-containing protein [Oxalobacteraceae bacterium R-40]